MTDYVLGFAFDRLDDNQFVLLIEKTKPEWQKGKLNGIGGKINVEEVPVNAMVREFKEETGIDTVATNWRPFGFLVVGYPESKEEDAIYLYLASIDLSGYDHSFMHSVEGIVKTYHKDCLPGNCLPNLNWLIPMAYTFLSGKEKCNKFHIYEGY